MKQSKRQASSSAKLKGATGFEQFYAERFANRWQTLREALLKKSAPAMLLHTGCAPYYLDAASIMAASMLPAGGKNILDMCAAPGGKSLVISSLMDENASLTCFERSNNRYTRLCNTLDGCLPPIIRARITAKCADSTVMCRSKMSKTYDRILLDAPCSSERHVLTCDKYLALWSPSRIKSLAMSQWALISSAWRMLETGGYLLYSTCALCREENDGIIERLLQKFPTAMMLNCGLDFSYEPSALEERIKHFVSDYAAPKTERTQFGNIALPDKSNGAGPIYFSLITKL